MVRFPLASILVSGSAVMVSWQGTPVARADEGGSSASATAPVSAPVAVSDDFSGPNLDRSTWRFENPRDDAALRILRAGKQARLEIDVPGGAEHTLTTQSKTAPRIMQDAANRDFRIEVRFDSVLTERFQIQGILVEQDAANFLRFDFYGDGSQTKSHVSSYRGKTRSQRSDRAVPLGSPAYMRVERAGSRWTQLVSSDGVIWTPLVSFDEVLAVSSIGLFAANEGATADTTPPVTSVVDYFFDQGAPIVPEDGAVPGADRSDPLLHSVNGQPAGSTLIVRWQTDERTTGSVTYGKTEALELGAVQAKSARHSQAVTLGVEPSTAYYFRVDARDSSGNTAASNTFLVVTPQFDDGVGPTIELFYGPRQTFGRIGRPQNFVNLLGNVRDPDGVQRLSYALNGGPWKPLSLGPDLRRLLEPGDFNIDLETSRLKRGTNLVEVQATDFYGNRSTSVVRVILQKERGWPNSYVADWSAGDVTELAQVVDGRWTIVDDPRLGTVLRPLDFGYDRLVAIGQGPRDPVGPVHTWTDYEVSAPITIHALDPSAQAYAEPSNGPGVGFVLRWPGHSVNRRQPYDAFLPLGAFISVRFNSAGRARLEIFGNSKKTQTATKLVLGKTYVFKARVESSAAGPLYRFKVWPQGSAEPAAWDIELQQGPADPQAGSILLVAHHASASFGNVSVLPLSAPSP